MLEFSVNLLKYDFIKNYIEYSNYDFIKNYVDFIKNYADYSNYDFKSDFRYFKMLNGFNFINFSNLNYEFKGFAT